MTGRLANIQALRLLAALLVVCVHLDALRAPLGLAAFGFGGVDIFFVISGLVIARGVLRREMAPLTFLAARLIRITPLYWLFTLLVFALALAAPAAFSSTAPDPVMLLKSLLFIPFDKGDGVIEPLFFVGWTLNYEIAFYTLLALTLCLLRGRAAIVAAVLGIGLIALLGALFSPDGVVAGFYSRPLILEFAGGCVLALLEPWLPASAGRVARASILLLVALAFGVLLSAKAFVWEPHSLLFCGLPAVVIVTGGLCLERWGWRLNGRLVQAGGDASYAIYLAHPFVAVAVQKLAAPFSLGPVVSFVLILLSLAAAMAVGMLIHRLVERPVLVALRARMPGLRRPTRADDR